MKKTFLYIFFIVSIGVSASIDSQNLRGRVLAYSNGNLNGSNVGKNNGNNNGNN